MSSGNYTGQEPDEHITCNADGQYLFSERLRGAYYRAKSVGISPPFEVTDELFKLARQDPPSHQAVFLLKELGVTLTQVPYRLYDDVMYWAGCAETTGGTMAANEFRASLGLPIILQGDGR